MELIEKGLMFSDKTLNKTFFFVLLGSYRIKFFFDSFECSWINHRLGVSTLRNNLWLSLMIDSVVECELILPCIRLKDPL